MHSDIYLTPPAGDTVGEIHIFYHIRGRGAADHALFIDDASVILTVYAGGTREDEGLRADFASPGERALHADIVGQCISFRPAAAGARPLLRLRG